MSLDVKNIDNEFLQCHLKYVYQTESPHIFHIWTALTSLGACMGRHVYLDTGIGITFGNMYVLLVGPPGTRKSSAIKFASDVMQKATDVRFAPDDTGGQRQGLIAALLDDEDLENADDLEAATAMDIEALMATEINLTPKEDRHTMFANASEFGSFIGQSSLELMRFMIKLWDGEDYKYQLAKTKSVLESPLLSLLGGTTPVDISMLLPPESIGQGFMSRIILVFAGHKEKSVPPSKAKLDTSLEPALQRVYAHVERNMKGAMDMTDTAKHMIDEIYAKELHIQDTRFTYYSSRRDVHLRKLTIILAVSRQSMIVELSDVILAEEILIATEEYMPDALGEFGLSPIAVARHKMLDYLRFVKEPVSENVLWALMQRDMKLMDFKNSLNALINLNKVTPLQTDMGLHYMYKDEVAKIVTALGNEGIDALLMEEPP